MRSKKVFTLSSLALVALLVLGFGLFGSSKSENPPSRAAQPSVAGASTQNSHGVYIADFFSSPTNPKTTGGTSRTPQLGNSNIDGYLQAYKWNACQPNAPNQSAPNWDSAGCSMDTDIRAAYNASPSKKIALSLDTGAYVPAWAYGNNSNNAIVFTIVTHNGNAGSDICSNPITIPIPWNRNDPNNPNDPSLYETNLKATIDTLASHLKNTLARPGTNDPTTLYDVVSQIKLTGITEDTEELRMPEEFNIQCKNRTNQSEIDTVTDAPGAWYCVGYNKSYVEAFWKSIAREWGNQFSSQTLTLPTLSSGAFPATNTSGSVMNVSPSCVSQAASPAETQTTTDLVNAGIQMFPGRFMMMHQALQPSSTYTDSIAAHTAGALIGFQLEDLSFGQTDTTPESDFTAAINIGLGAPHMSYLEIFPNDPTLYPSELAVVHAALNPTTPSCPSGQTGTPPNCVTQSQSTCPSGQIGTPPNCVTPPVTCTTCGSGSSGNRGGSSGASATPVTISSTSTTTQLGLPAGVDPSKVARVTYELDGKLLAIVTKAPFTYQLTTATLTRGCHTLKTIVLDKDGTTSTSSRQLCITRSTRWYQHPALNLVVIILLLGAGGMTALLIYKPIWRLKFLTHMQKIPPLKMLIGKIRIVRAKPSPQRASHIEATIVKPTNNKNKD